MRSLENVRVVVTRAAHQAEELAGPLRLLGAEVILLPTIGIAPPADPEPLRQAAAHCNEYDWIVFTSANAIPAFADYLTHPAETCKARVATIGVATRETAERYGFTISLTPEKYVAESLVDAFRAHALNGLRILLPSAAVTRDVIPAALRKRGAAVDIVEAYRNVIPPQAAQQAALVFREPFPDWVVFASSSAVANLARLIGTGPLRRVNIASIGPITSAAVRENCLEVLAEAAIQSIPSLVEAICSARIIG